MTSERRSSAISREEKEYYLEVFERRTSARGALSGAHAVPRLFRAPSPTLRTRTTRSNDPRPDLLAPHLPGRPVAFDPKELSEARGERVFPCPSPSPPSRPRPPRARPYPGPPRAHAATVRPRSAPGRARYAPPAPRTLHSPAAPRRAPPRTSAGAAEGTIYYVAPPGGFGGRRRGSAPRRAGRHRRVPRARRDVGVITPARPTRDVAPKSTRSRLTGSLPRSHPPRDTLGSLARINARRC